MSAAAACPRCAYRLAGLSAAACPECGLRLDEPYWWTDGVRPMSAVLLRAALPGAVLFVIGALIWTSAFGGPNVFLAVATPFVLPLLMGMPRGVPVLPAVLVAFFAYRAWRLATEGSMKHARRRGIIAIAISIVVTLIGAMPLAFAVWRWGQIVAGI